MVTPVSHPSWGGVGSRDDPDALLRAVAARSRMRYAGLSQRDVADLLKVGSGAAVCNQINRLPQKLARDRRLRRQLKQAEEAISKAYRERANRTDWASS